MDKSDCFALAQDGYAKLKAAVYGLLEMNTGRPMTNVKIGRTLGIYGGHLGHVGHISRTILEELKNDELIEQDPETKAWRLICHRKEVG